MLHAWKYLRLAFVLLLAGGWVAGTAWSVTRATDYSWALWLEHWTGDIRTALFSHRPKRMHSQVAIVTINDETMQPYTYRSPIDRRLLARLVTGLDNAGARAIGLDFLFLKQTEPGKDAELVSAILNARSRVIVAAGDKRIGLNPAQSKYQATFLKESRAIGGYANLLTGGDRIVRYVARPEDPAFTKSFAVALAKPDAQPPANGPRRIAWSLTPHAGKPRFFTMAAHLLVAPNGQVTPAAPILLKTYFKDKIVIIGGDFPDVDRHQVPMLSWRGEDDEIAGMLIQAQIAAQLLDNRSIEHLNRNVLTGVFGFLALLGLWFGLRHGFVAVSLYATTASLLVVATDMALFHFMDRIIPFGACLAALLLGVAGGVLLRLLRIATIRAA
jgi:CHASE2 domain-containing sensor protein